MRVICAVTAFFHGQRFEPNEPFDLSEGTPLSEGMTVIDDDAPAPVVKGGKSKPAPSTLSEMTRKAPVVKGVDGGTDVV